MFYVATRAVYVLVEAASEADARRVGEVFLSELYRARLRRVVPVNVQTVRPATDTEIEAARIGSPSAVYQSCM